MAPQEQGDHFVDESETPSSHSKVTPSSHSRVGRPPVHIPTDEEVETHVEELHGHDDWRSKTLHVLHAKPITFTLLGLLVLDVFILFAELYLGAEYPSCTIIERDAISCCPAEEGAGGDHGGGTHRWLQEMQEIVSDKGFYRDAADKWTTIGSRGKDWSRALAEDAHADGNLAEDAVESLFHDEKDGHGDDHGDEHGDDHGDDHGDGHGDDHGDDHHGDDHGDGHSVASASAHGAHGDGHHAHSYCTNGLTDMDPAKYPAACDPHKYEALHHAHHVLFWLTIAILGTFFLELSIMIVCLGCTFFTKPFYVLDLFVVTTSLLLELTFHFVDQESLASLAGLLILARLWRFVRIGHGLVESTNKWQAQKHERLLKYIDQLEGLCKDNGVELPDRQSIRNLKLLNDEESKH